MDKSTIICRCEEINIDEIETAIKMGAHTFNDIKRLTRCGMGPCQAKMCMDLVADIIHKQTNIALNNIKPPRMRMPIKLIRLEELAGDTSKTDKASPFAMSVSEEDDVLNER